MCWSETATYAMVGLGTAATVVAVRRGEPTAIWVTLGFFTGMEGLQAAGYAVVDQCGSGLNQSVTLLSYLHIAFQPIVINAFAMALVPGGVSQPMRRRVYGLASLATLLLLVRLMPLDWAGRCVPGETLCGPALCTISGDWHIGWEVPLNNLWSIVPVIDVSGWFPAYMLAVFVLPLFYGAWRFALFHLLVGPVLAYTLTSNPNEYPAIWCLFSIGIILIALSPVIRRQVAPRAHERAGAI